MGCKIGKHMRKGLSLIVALCMVVTLCPASALASPTPEEAQEKVDSYVPTEDVQGGEVASDDTTNAQTTVTVSTYSTFRCVESTGPTGTITVAASKQENTDSGRLTARFEGARPYQTGATVGGQTVNYPHYVMELTWTKNGRANAAYKMTVPLKASANATSYDVDCSLNSIFGDADREGTYVFSMTLIGENDMRAQGTTFAEFTITDSTFTRTTIDNPGETPYTIVTGSFDDAAVLNVTDITNAQTGGNAAVLGMLRDEAADKQLAEAWDIQIVNGSLLPAPTLFHSATNVQIDLAAATRDKLVGLAEGESFTIVSLVNGEQHSVTFTKGATVDGVTTFTSTTTDGDGVALEAVLTVPDSGNATLSFATAGLGSTLGAFGLAFASSAGSYTVNATVQNGTISPAGQIARPVGTDAAFQMSPLGGYLLEDPIVTISPSSAQYVIDGNTLIVKSGTAGQSITVDIAFKKYEDPETGDPDDPAVPEPFDINVTGYCAESSSAASDSIIEATYTKVDAEGFSASTTSQGSQLTLGRVRAGTPVLLNFKVVKDGYVVTGVKTAKTQSGLSNATVMNVSANTFTISAATAEVSYVQVIYEPGVQPPTLDVTHMVTGLAGEGGTVAGSVEPGVTHGDYFISGVRAANGYVIDQVWVFASALASLPSSSAGAIADLSSAAQGKLSYDVVLTSVTSDMTVAATFKRAPVTVNLAQMPGGTLSMNGQAGEPPYQIEAGTNASFSFTVQDGYTFDGVFVGDQKKSLADLGISPNVSSGTFSMVIDASVTLTPVFTPNEIPDTTKYLYAMVVSDGNGTVSPEGGASFVQGGTLTLNFGIVEGKETWRAKTITVSAGSASRTAELTESDWGAYVFDPAASPWDQLSASSLYIISVAFEDKATPSQPNPPALPKQAHIQLGASEGGQISPAGTLQDGQYVYDVTAGARQTFTMIPDEGYVVDKVWMNVDAAGAVTDQMRDVTNASVDGTPLVSGGTLAFTPAADATYKVFVEFKAAAESPVLRWNVETSVDGIGGSITPDGAMLMQDGQVQTFTFVKQTGYQLASVMVQTTQESSFAGVAAQNMTNMVVGDALKLTINANTRVVAAFEKIPAGTTPEPEKKTFTVIGTATTGGSISPATSQTLYVDSSLMFSMKADRGYQLTSVEVTCDSPALSISPKVSDMNEDNGTYSYLFGLPANINKESFAGKTVHVNATFERVPTSYTVTVVTEGPAGVSASSGPDDPNGYGYVSPGYGTAGSVQVAKGASQMFYFIERAGYVVSDVYVGSTRVAGSTTSYLLSGVASDVVLRVVYAAQASTPGTDEDELVTVSASAGAGGAISPVSARVPLGGQVTFTIEPDAGKRIDSFTVDGKDQLAQLSASAGLAVSTYTLAPVSGSHTVRVSFADDDGSGSGEERPGPGETALHKIWVNVAGPGTVTPGGFTSASVLGSVEVAEGGQQTFSFLPDEAPEGMVNVVDTITVSRGSLQHTVANASGHYTFFDVRSDMTLAVVFKQVQKGSSEDPNQPVYERYTVSASASAGGTIAPEGDTVVNAGASLTVRAVADAGYRLSYVAIDADASGAAATYVPASELENGAYTFANIQSDRTIHAVFAPEGAQEEGFTAYAVDVDGSKVQASLTGVVNVKEGASQTLVLAPTYGNTISRVVIVDASGRELWQMGVTGDAAKHPVSVPLEYRDGVASAVVLVELGPGYGSAAEGAMYQVSTSVAPDDAGNKLGTITPGGTQMLPAGSDVTFTMVPFSGCTVDSVTANGAPVSFVSENGYYQFSAHDLSGALSVVAKFRRIEAGEDIPAPGKVAEVTFDVSGAGSIQPESPAYVRPGDDLTITLIPKPGAHLGTLAVDGKDVTADASLMANSAYIYTIKGVTADARVEATFVNADGTIDDVSGDINVQVKVDVKVSGNAYGGTVDPNRTLTLAPGASQLFLIKPADGFYVAEAAIERADGTKVRADVRPWQPSYGSAATQQARATETASEQTAQVSSIGSKATAENTAQKSYSYVRVDDIRESFVLRITFDDCMNDPANTNKDYYLYTDAADDLVAVDPGVSGNGTVRPSDNTDVVDENGDKTLIITPGTNEKGELEELESITIHGTTIDLSGDDVRTDGKQDPQKVVDKVKGSGVLLPGEDFKWVAEPAPGHYELTLKAEQGEDGKWTIDQPQVDFTGEGPAFTNQVVVRAYEIDAQTGKKAPVDGVLKITATRLEDDKVSVDEPLYVAYGGALRIEAELLSADYELVSIEPDGTAVTSAPRAQERASEPAALADARNVFYAYGPGSIAALVQKRDAGGSESGESLYYVEATAGAGGSVSAPAESYKVGQAAQLTFTPDAGYQVASVTLNGQKSDYTSRTYTVPSEVCVKDAHVSVHVEFKATLPAAGDPQNAAGTRLLRTLTSLASTGDTGAPIATSLLAVACGALGVAVLVWSRTRRREREMNEE